MKIPRWHCYIVFNCAVIIPCLLGKPVSLNAIIAAENQKNLAVSSTKKPIVKGLVGKPVSLNAIIAGENQKKHASESTPEQNIKEIAEHHFKSYDEATRYKLTKSKELKVKTTPLIKQISSLKDRRSSGISSIKNRLKPKDILNKLRKKRKSKSNKREIIHNEDLDNNHISILRNLGKLFDKVFHKNPGTTYKRKGILKNNKIITETNGMVCTCQKKSGVGITLPTTKSAKKTAAHAKTFTAEVPADSETSAEAAANTAVANIRGIRQNKNLPLLLSRNPLSSWRNHNGHSKRSSSTFHGDLKRNITRNHGNSKYNSRIRENESDTESYETDTDSSARNSSSSDGFGRRDRNYTRSPNDRKKTNEDFEFEENEDNNGRSSEDIEGQIKFKIGRNETGSKTSIPEHDGGLREHVPEDQIGANTQLVQSKENHEKSNDNVTLDCTNDQRISDGSGAVTTEAEDVSSEDVTVISIKDLSNLTLALQSAPKGNLPVVTIFGGYSVAKDINGQNKLSEQSIHIYS